MDESIAYCWMVTAVSIYMSFLSKYLYCQLILGAIINFSVRNVAIQSREQLLHNLHMLIASCRYITPRRLVALLTAVGTGKSCGPQGVHAHIYASFHDHVDLFSLLLLKT